MQYQRLSEFFAARRQRKQPLVMATVIATSGSTYSKAGERMLIDANGDYQGMISGGCLEGDLAMHAASVFESQRAKRVTYALDDDDVFGLGAGCEGRLEILLQLLEHSEDYQPFGAIADAWRQPFPFAVAVMAGADNAGATMVHSRAQQTNYRFSEACADHLQAACAELAQPPYSSGQSFDDTLLQLELPQPSLLILGAGPDSEPLQRMANEMGWRTRVIDHRQSRIAPNRLAHELDLSAYHAAIVMSHNLDADRQYLEQLATSTIPYLALLGPVRRKQRLLKDLDATLLEDRLHAPAGLDLGGRGAASIAISIVAEIQQEITHGLLTSQ